MFLNPGPGWSGQSQSIGVKAFGTDCRILFRAGYRQAEEFKKSVNDWICSFEARYSRFRPDSIISRINDMAGIAPVTIDKELAAMFAICDLFHWSTKGLFDPSVLPLIRLWDFRSANPQVPSAIEVERAKSLVGWPRMKRDGNSIMLPEPGMGIDLGGFGKEYAIDRVMQLAIEFGIEDIMVDFGCDIRVHGVPPQGGLWRIGIEDPGQQDRCQFGIGISGKAVATSGDYRRNFVVEGKRFGHIIDPRTGYPASSDCLSVSVVAATCVEAGQVARAAFLLGADEGLSLMRCFAHTDGVIVTGHKRTETDGFGQYILEKQKTRATA